MNIRDACGSCATRLAPLGRAVLTLTDGGLVEVLAFACTGPCRAITWELPAVSSMSIPDFKREEDEVRVTAKHVHAETVCAAANRNSRGVLCAWMAEESQADPGARLEVPHFTVDGERWFTLEQLYGFKAGFRYRIVVEELGS